MIKYYKIELHYTLALIDSIKKIYSKQSDLTP
jgi:hypothetical protein